MRFSIIIPSYNRERALKRCLEALAALDYPHDDFQVIVVDDGSARPLWEITEPFLGQLTLQTLRQKNAGPARARNLGAEHARGELLAFLDDDCVPRKRWLTEFDLAAKRNAGTLVGGKTRNGCRDNVFAEVNQKLIDVVVGWFCENGSELRFFPSNNFVVPASDFHEIGGFDAGFRMLGGEDREFCARWLRSGRRLSAAPEACMDHFHAQTIRSFCKMHFHYGRGAGHLHQLQKTSPIRFAAKGLYSHLFRGS